MEEQAIVGAVRIVHEGDVFVLRGMYVHPKHRGNGLGYARKGLLRHPL